MAKKKRKPQKKSLWYRICFKYKLSFFNENTLEEVWSFRLSGFSAITMIMIFALLLVAFTSVLIILTPVRNYLPGYLDAQMRKEIVQNVLRADSLEQVINIQSVYLENVVGILSGTVRVDSINENIHSPSPGPANYEISRGKKESAFVRDFEEEERYNLTSLSSQATKESIFFYKPVNGVLSSAFDSDIRHYGIDLTATPGESVLATLEGTVVYSGFDPNYGNVIAVQHKNGFLSFYKHNEVLLKKMGDPVTTGEAIALIGNTGKLSTGPHLHFELWLRGAPVNPAEYIVF
jgi:lipoprotein NlpD